MKPSKSTWEQGLYAKWKAEHPDVTHSGGYEDTLGTPREWWVRNYVETRLLPFIEKNYVSREKIRSVIEGMKNLSCDCEDCVRSGKTFNAALQRILATLTE